MLCVSWNFFVISCKDVNGARCLAVEAMSTSLRLVVPLAEESLAFG